MASNQEAERTRHEAEEKLRQDFVAYASELARKRAEEEVSPRPGHCDCCPAHAPSQCDAPWPARHSAGPNGDTNGKRHSVRRRRRRSRRRWPRRAPSAGGGVRPRRCTPARSTRGSTHWQRRDSGPSTRHGCARRERRRCA
eukprot:4191438-Prymnesium_polylepis.2